MTSDFEELAVPVAGGSLSVRVRAGNGPTVLLLHYWGGTGRTWARMISHLDLRTSVAYYDQRGWGRSNTLPGPFDLAQLAEDARRVIDALDTDVVLVGHSMGGKVAQLVAAENPSALAALVLVAPAPPEPPPALTAQYREQLAHAYDSAATVGQAVDHVLTAIPLDDLLRSIVIEDSLSGAAEARTEWPLRGIAEDITVAARRIRIDTMVIAASRDVVETVDVLRRHLVPLIPGARLQIMEGPGHLIPLEAPAALAGHLVETTRRRSPIRWTANSSAQSTSHPTDATPEVGR